MKIKDLVLKEIKGFWGEEPAENEKGIPVIKTNNLTYEGVINYSDLCYRSIDVNKVKDNFLIKGDLLIEKSGGTKTHSVGYVSYFDGTDNTYVCNNFILGLRINENIVRPKYIFYILKYMYENGYFAHCYKQTTGIQNLKKDLYLDFDIQVPDFQTQDNIINVLDKITTSTTKDQQKLKKYDDLVKSQFIEMFGNLKNNSKNFELATIKDYFRVGSSKRVFEKDWTKSGVPFYRAREVVKLSENGFVDNELFISEKMYQEYSMKYGKPCADDIIVTAVGTLGKTYIVKPNDKFYYKDGNIILFHKINDISSIYVNYLYQTDFIKDQIIKTANVITVGTYTIKNAQNTQIIVPPIELQNQFADFVKHIDKLKFAIKQSIEKLNLCYQSLMKEYFE